MEGIRHCGGEGMAERGERMADKFKAFLNNLRINNQELINRRFRELTRLYNQHYWHIISDTRNVHYLGSYGRETAIKGLSNINILLLLPAALYRHYKAQPDGPKQLLEDVNKLTAQSFPQAYINADNCLLLPFPDQPTLEIIPGFIRKGKSLYYPEPTGEGGWGSFNPLREIEVISEYNYLYGGKVKHLARMTRAWKVKYQVQMPGILIDTLVMNFMDDWEGKDTSFNYYSYMVRDFMEYLAGRRQEQLAWYAKGSNRKIHREEDFGAPANDAFKVADRGLICEEKGDMVNAVGCWREIFGELFPGTGQGIAGVSE